MTAGTLQAQTVSSTYATEASGAQAQANAAYIAMLETLRSTGQPAPGAESFVFTDPSTNTALYDPYGAALRTVAQAQGLNLCVSTFGTATASGGSVVNYATGSTIETSLSDPNATTAHATAIASAPSSAGVVGGVSGGSLVSIGLPLVPVTGIPASGVPYSPTPDTAAWIAGIEAFAITAAQGFDPAQDARRRLLGEPRDSDLLADAVWEELTGFWGITPDDIVPLEAQFGIYGSLPVLVVYFDDSYILIDGVNGLVRGPFADTVPFDPVPLLEAHAEYQPGTGARMVDGETGCETDGLGGHWNVRPPPDTTPVSPVTIPCPTDPSVQCPAPPVPFVPPNKPNKWPRHPTPQPGFPGRNPTPPFPGPTTNTNPGVEGNPTDWSCASKSNQLGDTIEFCSTITEVCDTNGVCTYRWISCVFDPPPSRNGTAPDPGDDWKEPITDLDGDPAPNNGKNCVDRWWYR